MVNDLPLSYADFARSIAAVHELLSGRDLPSGRTAIVLSDNFKDSWSVVLALQLLGLNTIAVRSLEQAAALSIGDCACVVVTAAVQQAQHIGFYAWPGAEIVVVPEALLTGATATALPQGAVGPGPSGGHILYTSGTTGSYKKVLWGGAADSRRSAVVGGWRGYDGETIFHASNFGLWTAAGYVQPRAVWHAGGCVVFDDRPDFLANLFSGRVTHVNIPPPDLKRLLSLRDPAAPAIPGLKIFSAGSVLPLATAAETARRISDQLYCVYGSTECSGLMHQQFRSKDDLLWLTPDLHRKIEVVDENGIECPAGVEGLLRVGLLDIDATEYIGDPDASARAFRGGYFYPGDYAMRRADGRIRSLGRASDVLNVQGQKIPVGPIESAIAERLGVDSVCVFSGQSDEGVEELVIAVETRVAPPQRALDAVAAEFPSFERVRFSILGEFPRGREALKKIQRPLLRSMVC